MAHSARVLIVDDEPSIRFVLERAVEKLGLGTACAASAEEARELLVAERFSLVLLDVRLPGQSGFDLLRDLQASAERPFVVMMTAQDTLASAVSAMRLGADEYVVKPFDLARLSAIVRELSARSPATPASPPREAARPALVGVSAAMVELSKQLGRAAASDLTVLVTGESGTGKELVARAIHEHSPRARGPFVTVNAAAIPRELLESELYGHEKGAFTSASVLHKGRFEQANGGTLFLDEIGELPFELQAKLLRAIQERSIDRVGSEQPRPIDVRLVAATNAELPRLVASGRFRADLFYRLSVLELRLPPLRDRPDDLLPLAEHFVARHAAALAGRDLRLDPAVDPLLRAHGWPGNVRELENAIQRALVYSKGDILRPADLLAAIGGGDPAAPAPRVEDGEDFETALRRLLPGAVESASEGSVHGAILGHAERELLRLALSRFEGNQLRAARWLGINRNTLRSRLVALGLSLAHKADEPSPD
ncbi:sigma-54-dependent transcriptional regulator [Vulgatibacter incomptus]|uniref:DNA-binding transcriptional regulator NtrC n=1 Tax=Vulgatibacter incomptus TaxID=1391653 RepID=A0A0K1PIH9_9BACT|nr:sigma-54 dependent transcriptional regulator [Vulgatibacter incomptus]AKU92919.1 two component, sigma54 specific, transcriptional regulator, Fis family [Vulgatibacter incomptus]